MTERTNIEQAAFAEAMRALWYIAFPEDDNDPRHYAAEMLDQIEEEFGWSGSDGKLSRVQKRESTAAAPPDPEAIERELSEALETYLWNVAHHANMGDAPSELYPSGLMTVREALEFQQAKAQRYDEREAHKDRKVSYWRDAQAAAKVLYDFRSAIHLRLAAFGADYDVWVGVFSDGDYNVQLKLITEATPELAAAG